MGQSLRLPGREAPKAVVSDKPAEGVAANGTNGTDGTASGPPIPRASTFSTSSGSRPPRLPPRPSLGMAPPGMAATGRGSPVPPPPAGLLAGEAIPPLHLIGNLSQRQRSIHDFNVVPGATTRGHLARLATILDDDAATDLFIEFCAESFCIEDILFWIDVQQFRNFDGAQEDIDTYGTSIVRKYLLPSSELSVVLTATLRQPLVYAYNTSACFDLDSFSLAQAHVFERLERKTLQRFFKSRFGARYFEQQVSSASQKQEQFDVACAPVKATITDFDKRRDAGTKFYMYGLLVETADSGQYRIWRRYSQLAQLHNALCSAFPNHSSSLFPPKILFARSQVRSVAERRRLELNNYLAGVFARQDLTQSDTVKVFFKPTLNDLRAELAGGSATDA
eukprot:m.309093 g.309093  ORF g.309093 m.309093 type:complete len:393 (+) comp19635_c0_seq1:1201-2379(+)